jgi:hypothetical protein
VRRDAERLADIIEAADKITARVAKGRETFDKDEDVQSDARKATFPKWDYQLDRQRASESGREPVRRSA